jgi:GntR family transcriptional regulator / MocR family aminotransferase
LSARQALPSSRALAAELSVSRTTVVQVVDQLCAEGYLVARARSGSFVADALAGALQGSARRRAHTLPGNQRRA